MAANVESAVTSGDGEFRISLMNLSDDVLLYILSHLKSNDLTSLSRTCSRMQQITSDKSLWNTIHYKINSSSAPYLFFHENMCNIGKHTRSITVKGKTNRKKFPNNTDCRPASSASESSSSEDDDFVDVKYNIEGDLSMENKAIESSPENGESPVYPLEDYAKLLNGIKHNIDRKWLRLHLLSPLANICPSLHTLRLQYLRLFYYAPPILPAWDALVMLSLRGSRLLSKTSGKHGPLYELSVRLPNLACLDIGCCSWVESHCFMAISKFKKLRTLLLDSCPNLGNCVAYTSLAACLGFPAIEEINLRDTQFGDSDLLSFKRNSTIKKVVLGRQVNYARKQADSSESEEEQNSNENLAGSSGACSTGSGTGHSNEHRQGGKKRKNPGKIYGLERKRIRLGGVVNPPEALVIHVDLGLGVRVEHVHEAGEYDWLTRNLAHSVGNMVTDEGIISLGIDGLPALEHLVLAGGGPRITDQSLFALKKRTGLKYLDVRRTRVTKAVCESFVRSCPDVHLDCDFSNQIDQLSSSY